MTAKTFDAAFVEVKKTEGDLTGEILTDHFGHRWLVVSQTRVDADGLAFPILLDDGTTIHMTLEPALEPAKEDKNA